MDLESAEEALQISYGHLRRGTGDPIERALFLDLKASLRAGQRRFDEAVRLLNRAMAIFFRYRDDHLAGKSLVSLAAILTGAGQLAEAVPVLERAVTLIDPSLDERLLLVARHNLIDDLAMLGRFVEAQGLYRRTRGLYRKNQDKDKALNLRRLWIKGKIERGLGHEDSSESLFLAAREGFLAEDLPYEAALVSMELATLYAEQHRTAKLKQLATEVLSIFTSRHIYREALAAVILFVQAIRQSTPSA
jgi:tetratricopeptide (TPR) repeat protein